MFFEKIFDSMIDIAAIEYTCQSCSYNGGTYKESRYEQRYYEARRKETNGKSC